MDNSGRTYSNSKRTGNSAGYGRKFSQRGGGGFLGVFWVGGVGFAGSGVVIWVRGWGVGSFWRGFLGGGGSGGGFGFVVWGGVGCVVHQNVRLR